MINPSQVPVVEFNERDTIRLISTAYIDEPTLTPLVDDVAELAFLENIEGLTSVRQNSGLPLPAGVHAQELLSENDGYGWSYVNAAFCYTRSTGNRFNGPDRGAWYASWGRDASKTSQAEVSWHLTQELTATGIYENITSYRELIAGFIVDMHDLRGYPEYLKLSPDTIPAYPKGQVLAASLIALGSQGVIYPSIRYTDGFCLAAFRPRTVQNIRQGNTWKFSWNGQPKPVIELLN